jgi:hypothetical protein
MAGDGDSLENQTLAHGHDRYHTGSPNFQVSPPALASAQPSANLSGEPFFHWNCTRYYKWFRLKRLQTFACAPQQVVYLARQ